MKLLWAFVGVVVLALLAAGTASAPAVAGYQLSHVVRHLSPANGSLTETRHTGVGQVIDSQPERTMGLKIVNAELRRM